MATEGMPITPAVITWAREQAGYSLDAAAGSFPKIAAWEAGDKAPSYPQLEDLADKFKVPVAIFFFPAPPVLPPIQETFRTLGAEQIDQVPPRIRLMLRKALSFQIGLEEIYQGRNAAHRLITRDLEFRVIRDVDMMAQAVRKYLGVSLKQQCAWKDAETALNNWRRKFVEVGVHVFKDQFHESGYSGFCLYHDEFPLIYVNNTTSKTRQTFTLFHELAHLLFHTSGIDARNDDYINELPRKAQQIEIICNRLASRILMPDDALEQVLAGHAPDETTASNIAAQFNVSRELIYRKFLDQNLITTQNYDSAVARWSQRAQSSGGGDYYHTKIAYLGDEYIARAFQQFYQNRIDVAQLADYLDTKPKNLAQLEEYALRRAS